MILLQQQVYNKDCCQAALNAIPVKSLDKFGLDHSIERLNIHFRKVEVFLVQVLQKGSQCAAMDELIHHMKNNCMLLNFFQQVML